MSNFVSFIFLTSCSIIFYGGAAMDSRQVLNSSRFETTSETAHLQDTRQSQETIAATQGHAEPKAEDKATPKENPKPAPAKVVDPTGATHYTEASPVSSFGSHPENPEMV